MYILQTFHFAAVAVAIASAYGYLIPTKAHSNKQSGILLDLVAVALVDSTTTNIKEVTKSGRNCNGKAAFFYYLS